MAKKKKNNQETPILIPRDEYDQIGKKYVGIFEIYFKDFCEPVFEVDGFRVVGKIGGETGESINTDFYFLNNQKIEIETELNEYNDFCDELNEFDQYNCCLSVMEDECIDYTWIEKIVLKEKKKSVLIREIKDLRFIYLEGKDRIEETTEEFTIPLDTASKLLELIKKAKRFKKPRYKKESKPKLGKVELSDLVRSDKIRIHFKDEENVKTKTINDLEPILYKLYKTQWYMDSNFFLKQHWTDDYFLCAYDGHQSIPMDIVDHIERLECAEMESSDLNIQTMKIDCSAFDAWDCEVIPRYGNNYPEVKAGCKNFSSAEVEDMVKYLEEVLSL